MSRSAFLTWLFALSLAAPATIAQAATGDVPAVHVEASPPHAAATSVRPQRAPAPLRTNAQTAAAPDRLIVTFAQADPALASRVHAAVGATSIATAAHGRVHVVRVDPAQRDALLAAYKRQPGVVSVSLDRTMSATETPSDPLYGASSGAGYTEGWSLDAIGAPTAWNVSHGAGVKVAVVDTGIFACHPDLAGQVVAQQDFTGSASGTADVFGHGTHVAGTIAALENNGAGLAGVAPQAQLINAKVLGDDGSGSMSNVITAIPWAVQQGAKVINMSLGADSSCDPALQTAIDDAWSAGVVLVAAAGNSGTSGALEPADCNHVIGVGASTVGGPSAPGFTEGPTSFTNYGPGVLLAAPGDNVYSTMLTSGYLTSPTGYGPLSGTSMATPQVSGTAALVWASPYGTSNESVLNRLTSTADAIAGTGSDWTYGRVDAAAAVGATALAAPAHVYDGLGAEASTQASTTSLSANWTAVSGAAGYQYEIGTAAGQGDVAGWTDNGTALAMTQNGLSLLNNTTYYTSVRAYDSHGTDYAASSSSGVRVAVPVSAVTILAAQASTTQVAA